MLSLSIIWFGLQLKVSKVQGYQFAMHCLSLNIFSNHIAYNQNKTKIMYNKSNNW